MGESRDPGARLRAQGVDAGPPGPGPAMAGAARPVSLPTHSCNRRASTRNDTNGGLVLLPRGHKGPSQRDSRHRRDPEANRRSHHNIVRSNLPAQMVSWVENDSGSRLVMGERGAKRVAGTDAPLLNTPRRTACLQCAPHER